MSNLLKQGFLTIKEPETRIIDTNELVAAKIEALLEAERGMSREDCENGFIRGLEAEKVEMLLSEKEPDVKTPEELEQEANEVLENAQREADELLQHAQDKAEAVQKAAFEQGQKQGYEDGYHKALAEVEEMKKVLQEEQVKLELDYHQKLEEMEALLLNKILEVLEDTLAIELKSNQELLLYLLKKNMGQVESSRSYFLRVSKEDIEDIQKNRTFLMEGLSPGTRLEFIEDGSLEKGQCRMETDGGIFDCSLDIQFASLKKSLQMLAGGGN